MSYAILVDIDGTLLDLHGIRDWALGKRTDYDEFHRIAADAPAISSTIVEVLSHWDMGIDVVLLTARSEKYRAGTMQWLTKHSIPYHYLYMRRNADNRPDMEFKAEALMNLEACMGFDFIKAYEDNPEIVKLWETMGLKTVVVEGWDS